MSVKATEIKTKLSTGSNPYFTLVCKLKNLDNNGLSTTRKLAEPLVDLALEAAYDLGYEEGKLKTQEDIRHCLGIWREPD